MIKDRKFVAAIVLVLVVVLAAGGFALEKLSGGKKVDNLSNNDTVPQNVQQENITSESSQLASEKLSEDNNEDKDNGPKVIAYTVKAGDTLESISKSYGIKANTIAQSNGISLNSIIREGQELKFPSVDGALYKIKSGETLWDLASTYDIDEIDLAELNKIDAPNRLQIGQQIIIPGVDKLKTENAVAIKNTTTKVSASNSTVKIASRSTTAKTSPASREATSGSGIWPVKGTVTSGYGMRWGKKHQGIDIAAPTGTNIYAFMSGKVVFSGWNNGGYGNLVIIDHGNGLRSYYAHDSKVLVSVGEYVNKGAHIAEVGSTGDSTGPHCHFEVRKNGVPVNPYSYLK